MRERLKLPFESTGGRKLLARPFSSVSAEKALNSSRYMAFENR
jgi:hypothetical protein